METRMVDFGMHYWTSHHPYVVPEPMTLEPTESYSQADLDEYVAALKQVAGEAYTEPDTIRTAPHNSTVHQTNHEPFDNPDEWAVTWRAYKRKTQKQ
jgi:glycine dehydrogenase subunit 2